MQHLIIIDEIDSMFGSRGVDSSSAAANRATAMFISMMDDLNLRSNLFVIGTTNRFDLVDPAVVRSGRLGLHLEVAAMDTNDKVDVLRLYLEYLEELHPMTSGSEQQEEVKEQVGSSCDVAQIVTCFRQRFSSMSTSMIRDAIGRAVIEKETQNSRFLTAEHFEAACSSLLTNNVDSQSRFRKLLARQNDTELPSLLQDAAA